MQNDPTVLINMNEETKECPICLLDATKMVTFPCNHYCCSNCWKQIIKAANSNFNVEEIKCFDLQCKKPIQNSTELVSLMSDKNIANRFQYLQKKQEVFADKNKFLCPNDKCKKILSNGDQEKIKHDYKNGFYKPSEQDSILKNINNLDYSFMVCDDCSTVFCKICEIYHEPGQAKCNKTKKESSEKIIKVTNLTILTKSEQ
jgi:hypothetical protein